MGLGFMAQWNCQKLVSESPGLTPDNSCFFIVYQELNKL